MSDGATCHVVFFDGYPHTYGGSQKVMLDLAVGLRARCWPVAMVLPADGPYAARLRAAGVAVHVVPVPVGLRRHGRELFRPLPLLRALVGLPAFWWRLSRALKVHAEVVHTSSQRGILLAGPAARLARRPLVWHVHGVKRPQPLNLIGRLLASRTIAVSERVARELPGRRLLTSPVIVPNTIDDRFRRVVRPAAPAPVVVTAARLHHEKGVDVFLRALALVRQTHPAVTGVVLGASQEGHGSYAAGVLRLRDELGLTGHVEFPGFVDAMEGVLARAAVYVQPSRFESFGLAAVEAMAAGVPVVACAVGGLAELVDDGRTGALVPPDDPDAMAAAIRTLLDDPNLASRLAAAARDAVANRFSLDASVDTLVGVYRSMRRAGRR